MNGRNKRWAEQRWDKRQPERLEHIRKKKEDESHEKAMRKPRSPYLKLARLIEDEGFEHREFAKLVGMGESTLSTRLNPKPEQKNNEWRHYEITAICRELHIPQEQIGEYFFPKVEKGA